jgi:hypothetical protein
MCYPRFSTARPDAHSLSHDLPIFHPAPWTFFSTTIPSSPGSWHSSCAKHRPRFSWGSSKHPVILRWLVPHQCAPQAEPSQTDPATTKEVITQLAAGSDDLDSMHHRIGCHVVQVLDLVKELVNLDRSQQRLTSSLWSRQMNPATQRHYERVEQCRSLAARRFQRLPNSPSLAGYSDDEVKTLGQNFSVNPACVLPDITSYWKGAAKKP